jgi:transcriptional regulator of acetoin/glycerol metabolism
MDRLLAHDWPGNVRELQNVMIRYCHSQKIELMETLKSPFETSVADDIPPASDSGTLRSIMDAYEKKVIEAVLRGNQWHRSHAARLLGIDRKTLFTKMKRHGLSRPQHRPSPSS